MVHDERDTGHSALLGTLVIIMLVVIAILLVAYFAWWTPTMHEVIIERNQPAKPSSSPITAPQPSMKQPAKALPNENAKPGGQQPGDNPTTGHRSGG